jgi:hypothetical protein
MEKKVKSFYSSYQGFYWNQDDQGGANPRLLKTEQGKMGQTPAVYNDKLQNI